MWICRNTLIHAITPLKLHGKPRFKCIKSRTHAKVVVNLQPQCDFCKDKMHYSEKTGLPCRFNTHFDPFCPHSKIDTGLPPIYMMVLELIAIVLTGIPVLPITKPNAFVQKTSKCMTRSDHGTSLLHRRHSRCRNTLVPYRQVFGPQCCA